MVASQHHRFLEINLNLLLTKKSDALKTFYQSSLCALGIVYISYLEMPTVFYLCSGAPNCSNLLDFRQNIHKKTRGKKEHNLWRHVKINESLYFFSRKIFREKAESKFIPATIVQFQIPIILSFLYRIRIQFCFFRCTDFV